MSETVEAKLLIKPSLEQGLAVIDTLPVSSSVFLQPFWLNSWCRAIPQLPDICTFFNGANLIGFCFIGTLEKTVGPIKHKTALVNQLGSQESYQSWIEYNGIVCDPVDENACAAALVALLSDSADYHEITVSMASNRSAWISASAKTRGVKILEEAHPCYALSLSKSDTFEQLVTRFSKNTRAQIRRSLRKVESQLGELCVSVATTRDMKKHYLAELGERHKQRWQNTEQGSGFNNPIFVGQLDQQLTDFSDKVQIVRVQANDYDLGYCFNLLDGRNVYFYCSGINYEFNDKHIKPGYLVHTLLATYYAQQGFTRYDFLGGESQYKQSLADEVYHQHTLTLTLPKISARALRTAHSLLSRWQSS